MEDGDWATIADASNGAPVNVPLLMGGDTTPRRAIGQSTDQRFPLGPRTLIAPVSQAAVCTVISGWLRDLTPGAVAGLRLPQGSDFVMPRERIDNLLEPACEGATHGAVKLQAAVLIFYASGQITVLYCPVLKRGVRVRCRDEERICLDHGYAAGALPESGGVGWVARVGLPAAYTTARPRVAPSLESRQIFTHLPTSIP